MADEISKELSYYLSKHFGYRHRITLNQVVKIQRNKK